MQGFQCLAELGCDEAGPTDGFGLEFLEADPGDRISVDRDQSSFRPDLLGDQARMPSRAEGAVDDGLPGLRPDFSPEESAEVLS